MNQNKQKIKQAVFDFIGHHPDIVQIIIDLIDRQPELGVVVPDILKAYLKLIKCFDQGHTLFICGNGGSFADSLHISSELLKSFKRKRALSEKDKKTFEHLPYGKEIGSALEYGFPVIVLGLNHSFSSALENDNPTPYIGFAQELYTLAKKDDLFMGISTGGNAQNVLYAVTVAKANGLTTIGLTGENSGELTKSVDIAIKVPGKTTAKIQELHLPVYHTICAIVEAHYFKEKRD